LHGLLDLGLVRFPMYLERVRTQSTRLMRAFLRYQRSNNNLISIHDNSPLRIIRL